MAWARVGLVVFVVAWLFDVFGLRWLVPIWLPFLVALGLELSLFVSAWRDVPPEGRDRSPQPIDLERYGFPTREEEEEREQGEDADEEELPPFYVPPPARRLRRLLVGLALIALLAGALWFGVAHAGWTGVDPDDREEAVATFSGEASHIVGRRVEIRCDESRRIVGAVQHADGVAVVGGRVAYLTPEICFDLYRIGSDDEAPFGRTARAIAVLAHESWHLRGERDEGRTECFALQSGVELGRRLGLSESTAERMMRQQLAENELRGQGALEYLVPPDCRDGGSLDLDPGSSEFP